MRPIACLLLATVLAAADSADPAFAASIRAEQSGDYATARSLLAPFEKRLSGDYLYQARMGWLALCAGDVQAALVAYRAAQRIAPSSLEPRLGLTRTFIAAQAWSDAETAARQVVQIDPLNYTGNLLLATALRAQGRSDVAKRQLDTLLERYPSDTAVLTLAAALASDVGRDQEARVMLTTLTRLGQDTAVAGR